MLKSDDGSLAEVHTRVNASGVNLTQNALINEWKKVVTFQGNSSSSSSGKKTEDARRWILCSYEEEDLASAEDIVLLQSGRGGRTEMVESGYFLPTNVVYGALSVKAGSAGYKPVFVA